MVGSAEDEGAAGSDRCVPEEGRASCVRDDPDVQDVQDDPDVRDDPGVAASP